MNGVTVATLPDGPLPYPFHRSDNLRPHPSFQLLRDQRPVAEVVLPNGTPAYLVTRYRDVCAVLEDSRFSRAALSKAAPQDLVAYAPPSQAVDPAASNHSMPYRLIKRWFTPRAVERMRPRAEEIADSLLDAIGAMPRPVDLVPALTAALPMAVMGELAGIPERDRQWIMDRAPLVTVDAPDELSRKASGEVFDYFLKQLAERSDSPSDDLLGHVVAAFADRAEEAAPERLAQLAMRACLPGFHSVSVTLSKGIPILLRQPEVYAKLHERRELVAPVVEELLRLTTPASTSLPRLALTDVELAGVTIPAGRVVVACLESANYDEQRYPQPDRIVADRGTTAHTTFGRGPNFCFGAALARMELQVVIAALACRYPGLRLAVPEEALRLRSGVIAPDVLQLPVQW